MDSAVVLSLGALMAGVVIGWWLANRSSAPLKSDLEQARSDGESWRLKFNEAIVNLAAEAEKNKRLVEVEALRGFRRSDDDRIDGTSVPLRELDTRDADTFQ